jgi:uncharacterized protein (TIGR02271 family)
MDSTNQEWTITEGTDVVGSDGDKVGEVVAVQDNYVVVEKGFFFPTDYYIPTSAISNFDGEKVYLNVTKADALNQGWDTEPTATTTDTYVDETVGTTTGTTAGATTGTYVDDTAGTTPLGGGTTDVDRSADYSDTRTATAGETINVPVQEEELTATRREVDRGAVRIEKDVVEEEQTLDVPVTEERVTVQRRTVDRDATGDDTAFEGGTIDVPVRGEEVDVQKRARVTEEVEIGKEAVERTERVSDTVRREEVRVDDETTDVTDRDRSR